MKNYLIAIFLVLTASRPCFSQNKGMLHLAAGGTLPVGKFASKDVNDPESGLARFGGLAGLAYSHPFGKNNWGYTIEVRGKLNGIDKQANETVLRQANPNFSWSSTGGPWKAISAMTGVYYTIAAGTKIDIRAELIAGAARCYLPENTLLGLFDTAHTGATHFIQAKVNKASTTAFSAKAQAGVIYHLSNNLHLMANLDFWYIKANFKDLTQSVIFAHDLIVPGIIDPGNASTINYSSITTDYQQPMHTVNISAGIGITL